MIGMVMVGLGRIGSNLTRRPVRAGHEGFDSRRASFGDRLIAAQRAEFGGHTVRSPADPPGDGDLAGRA